MQMSEFLSLALGGAGVLLLLAAGLHDAATRTIPNSIPCALIVVGSIQRWRDGQFMLGVVIVLILAACLVLLWWRGFVGGGDAKLIPAASLVLPASSVPGFVLAVAIAGGILALLYLSLSYVVPRPRAGQRTGLFSRLTKAELWRLNRRGPLPYAVAISTGALLMIGKTFFR
jgi:prepilin peptidase CpaA